MPWFNTAIVILAASYYSHSVTSQRPVTSTKVYNFNVSDYHQVIVGKKNIDNTVFVYAVCQSAPDYRSASYKLNFESDVFDRSELKSQCTLDLRSKLRNGKLDFIEINLWGHNEAIFVWRDINQDNLLHTEVTISTVGWKNCEIKEHKFTADNRPDNKSQIFVLPYKDSYDVIFMDKDRCSIMFCKVTVSKSGEVGEAISWFPYGGLVKALEPTDREPWKLFINYGEFSWNDHETKIVFLGETTWQELGSYQSVHGLGWSTSNGIISFCNYNECTMYDHTGKGKRKKKFDFLPNSAMYQILHNLPYDDHLALVCNTSVYGNYHILGIDRTGSQSYLFPLRKLKCTQKPKVLTGKFWIKNNKEYCLSLFYSVNSIVGKYNFSRYCFSVS